MFVPFGPVINPETGVPTVETREQALLRAEGEQGIRSRIRERTMQKIEELTGERPVYPSRQQLEALPSSQRRALALGQRDVAAAEAALQSAREMGVNFRLRPEAERGTYIGPEFEVDPGTGARRYLGMKPQVEQETIATPGYYQMRAAGGAGRQQGRGPRRVVRHRRGVRSRLRRSGADLGRARRRAGRSLRGDPSLCAGRRSRGRRVRGLRQRRRREIGRAHV